MQLKTYKSLFFSLQSRSSLYARRGAHQLLSLPSVVKYIKYFVRARARLCDDKRPSSYLSDALARRVHRTSGRSGPPTWDLHRNENILARSQLQRRCEASPTKRMDVCCPTRRNCFHFVARRRPERSVLASRKLCGGGKISNFVQGSGFL